MATLAFWLLFLSGVAAFALQVATRARLIFAVPNTFSLDNLPLRISRFLLDVVLQRRTIRERPVAGVMHAFVFWGFVAFGGYTTVELPRGPGMGDLTGATGFHSCRVALVPFACAVLVGIVYLLIRRAFLRPV